MIVAIQSVWCQGLPERLRSPDRQQLGIMAGGWWWRPYSHGSTRMLCGETLFLVLIWGGLLGQGRLRDGSLPCDRQEEPYLFLAPMGGFLQRYPPSLSLSPPQRETPPRASQDVLSPPLPHPIATVGRTAPQPPMLKYLISHPPGVMP